MNRTRDPSGERRMFCRYATLDSHPWLLTWNQSMVQQLIRDGNIRSLFLNASPIGLIARTTWRLARTRSMKKLYMANGVASIFLPWKKRNEWFWYQLCKTAQHWHSRATALTRSRQDAVTARRGHGKTRSVPWDFRSHTKTALTWH